jgi:hypothetical protein
MLSRNQQNILVLGAGIIERQYLASFPNHELSLSQNKLLHRKYFESITVVKGISSGSTQTDCGRPNRSENAGPMHFDQVSAGLRRREQAEASACVILFCSGAHVSAATTASSPAPVQWPARKRLRGRFRFSACAASNSSPASFFLLKGVVVAMEQSELLELG